MSDLKSVEMQQVDELVLQTKTLRDVAFDKMKDPQLAEKLHKVVNAWEGVSTLMLKRLAAKQISTAEQTTPQQTIQTNGSIKQQPINTPQEQRQIRP